ncbi:MAG: class I SAM-dependent methyltransferase [Bordetella sp.]|uniref:class I SAM-dependent methyltransferase n=1 Tax=Bordetella sp. TaxID=28081 RepID=UPI003F7C63C5
MNVLPPGTILQLMYLKERLLRLPVGKFIEVGPGSGEITRLLLEMGWTGRSYDLEEKTISALEERFAIDISQNRFMPVHESYLNIRTEEKVDLVISCMVMEHLDDRLEVEFMKKSAKILKASGLMIALVPASPEHWGIEDDIAGHCRRYTRSSVENLINSNGWKLKHIAGLTFPISNILLPVSNFLVNRSERQKLALSALERTKQSGRRSVKYKTHFPPLLGLLLNKYTLSPFHLLQKIFTDSTRSLVLFFEATP